MTCPRCQTENAPQAQFCLECAAPLVGRCASCGTELPAGAKSCFECAQPVGDQQHQGARFGSPESYTPRYLAERILNSLTTGTPMYREMDMPFWREKAEAKMAKLG